MISKGKKKFRRPCKKCEKLFRPKLPNAKLCDKCLSLSYKIRFGGYIKNKSFIKI